MSEKKVIVVQTRGYQCPICGTIYKGKGGKAKAQACFNFGDPKSIFKVGDKIITIGDAYNNAYEILRVKTIRSKTRDNNSYQHIISYEVKKFAYEQRRQAGNIWRATNEFTTIPQSTFLIKNFTMWIEGTKIVK